MNGKAATECLHCIGNEATWSFATTQLNISHKLILASEKMKYVDL